MSRSYDLYLKDIVDAINSVEEFTEEHSLETFSESKLHVDACVRNLEIIGEAATQMPKGVKEKYSKVPWQNIADFRNVVIHAYWKIDKEVLWNIIKEDLEPLKKQIEDILKEIKV
ncbi:DUF86 domain-containing protein [Candidatus Woesearchaeota archaeon]|nr:DUF86 domain-containing protein [Candidatus Woesearchaeota archaeon]